MKVGVFDFCSKSPTFRGVPAELISGDDYLCAACVCDPILVRPKEAIHQLQSYP